MTPRVSQSRLSTHASPIVAPGSVGERFGRVPQPLLRGRGRQSSLEGSDTGARSMAGGRGADRSLSHGGRRRILAGSEWSLGPRFQSCHPSEQITTLLVTPAPAIPQPRRVLEARRSPSRRRSKVGAVPPVDLDRPLALVERVRVPLAIIVRALRAVVDTGFRVSLVIAVREMHQRLAAGELGVAVARLEIVLVAVMIIHHADDRFVLRVREVDPVELDLHMLPIGDMIAPTGPGDCLALVVVEEPPVDDIEALLRALNHVLI